MIKGCFPWTQPLNCESQPGMQRSESHVSWKYTVQARNWFLLSSAGEQAQAGHKDFKEVGLMRLSANLVSLCVSHFFGFGSLQLSDNDEKENLNIEKMLRISWKRIFHNFPERFVEFWNFPIFLFGWRKICLQVCLLKLFRNIGYKKVSGEF